MCFPSPPFTAAPSPIPAHVGPGKHIYLAAPYSWMHQFPDASRAVDAARGNSDGSLLRSSLTDKGVAPQEAASVVDVFLSQKESLRKLREAIPARYIPPISQRSRQKLEKQGLSRGPTARDDERVFPDMALHF